MTTTDMTVRSSTEEKILWARTLADAPMLPREYRSQPANLFLAAEYADELGIGRMAALTDIHVINGKPGLSASLMQSLVHKAGHTLRVRFDEETMTATAELIRSDDKDFTFTVVWTPEKAKRAGLWGNRGPWMQYPQAMLKARAISEVIREGAAEVLHGALYTPEELEAIGQEPAAPAPLDPRAVDAVAAWADVHHVQVNARSLAEQAHAAGQATDPDHLTAWLTTWLAANEGTAGAADEVVQGELIEEVTDGE